MYVYVGGKMLTFMCVSTRMRARSHPYTWRPEVIKEGTAIFKDPPLSSLIKLSETHSIRKCTHMELFFFFFSHSRVVLHCADLSIQGHHQVTILFLIKTN